MKNIIFEINDGEKQRILKLHENHTKKQYLNLINESIAYSENALNIQKILYELELLKYSDIDGYYGKKTTCAVIKFQDKLWPKVQTYDLGKVTTSTALILNGIVKRINEKRKKNLKKVFEYTKVEDNWVKICVDNIQPLTKKNDCITIVPETCKKITANQQTSIGNGGKEGCSEYVRKMLNITLGNAWQAFLVGKNYGVKYNMFTNGEIDWNKVRTDIKNKKLINSTSCGCFIEEGESLDKKCANGEKIASLISSFYPSKTTFNVSSLKLGDIVGIYYGSSSNKGKGFCERAVKDRKLNQNGDFLDTSPFTFNTHVGYVGAIINGIPMIYHSVHGERLSTPANILLDKNSNYGMIVWVTGGPKIDIKQLTK